MKTERLTMSIVGGICAGVLYFIRALSSGTHEVELVRAIEAGCVFGLVASVIYAIYRPEYEAK